MQQSLPYPVTASCGRPMEASPGLRPRMAWRSMASATERCSACCADLADLRSGPIAVCVCARTARRIGRRGWGLFRSSDAGASWQLVWSGVGYPDRDNHTTLALSPAFAQDDTL